MCFREIMKHRKRTSLARIRFGIFGATFWRGVLFFVFCAFWQFWGCFLRFAFARAAETADSPKENPGKYCGARRNGDQRCRQYPGEDNMLLIRQKIVGRKRRVAQRGVRQGCLPRDDNARHRRVHAQQQAAHRRDAPFKTPSNPGRQYPAVLHLPEFETLGCRHLAFFFPAPPAFF